MSTPKGGLGRGLGSLLGGGPTAPAAPAVAAPVAAPVAAAPIAVPAPSSVTEVAVDAIRENPHQPRRMFAPEELHDLAESIRAHGILQPLLVTQLPDGGYELIAGERRLRAAREIGLARVPVLVRAGVEDQEKLELALIENIQRHDLNPMEEAQAFLALQQDFGLRPDEIGMRISRSNSYVSNTIRLLQLDPDIREAVASGKVTRSHARTLLAEPVPSRRREMFRKILGGEMTVRQVEAAAGNPRRRLAGMPAREAHVVALENELREHLGTKVVVEMMGTTGRISVHFYSKEELQTLIEKLMR